MTSPEQTTQAPPLLPCPFDGGSAFVDQNDDGFHSVFCTDCGAYAGYSKNEASAIAAWNRREGNERWLPVIGYEDIYEVSNHGNVKSLRLNRILSPKNHKRGYKEVSLTSEDGTTKSFLVHRLVLTAFAGECPEEFESRHLNGNKQDNRLDNLRWGSKEENTQDRVKHGNDGRGEKNSQAKLTQSSVVEILDLIESGRRDGEIAELYSVDKTTIKSIRRGKNWSHISRRAPEPQAPAHGFVGLIAGDSHRVLVKCPVHKEFYIDGPFPEGEAITLACSRCLAASAPAPSATPFPSKDWHERAATKGDEGEVDAGIRECNCANNAYLSGWNCPCHGHMTSAQLEDAPRASAPSSGGISSKAWTITKVFTEGQGYWVPLEDAEALERERDHLQRNFEIVTRALAASHIEQSAIEQELAAARQRIQELEFEIADMEKR